MTRTKFFNGLSIVLALFMLAGAVVKVWEVVTGTDPNAAAFRAGQITAWVGVVGAFILVALLVRALWRASRRLRFTYTPKRPS